VRRSWPSWNGRAESGPLRPRDPPARHVRTTRRFWADLHRQLGPDRGPAGEPSRIAFELHDLITILEVFTHRWDDLPEFMSGRPDYRVLIAPGVLVRAYSVYAGLARDGAVELLSLDIDTSWPEDPDADDTAGDED
jgi:hypothetical protein